LRKFTKFPGQGHGLSKVAVSLLLEASQAELQTGSCFGAFIDAAMMREMLANGLLS
jgi:hypothetical protein